MWCQWSWI